MSHFTIYSWTKGEDWWRLYCPQGQAWITTYLDSLPRHPMGGPYNSKLADDLHLFEEFIAKGFVITRQGRERYEQLLRQAEEEAELRRLRVLGHRVIAAVVDDPLPMGLKGSVTLDAGYVSAPYIPLEVEPLYSTLIRTRRLRRSRS